MVFLCGVRFLSLGLHQKEYFIAHERMTSSGDRHQGWEVKFKMSHLERDHMLESCHPFGVVGHVKIFLNVAFP
jgi:hypothetical protein